MKKLITTLVALSTISAFSAEIICGSTKAEHKRTYPINDAAIQLAAKLGIKTCTGTSSTRFKDAVKSGKHSGKFVVVSKEQLSQAKAALKKLGGVAGPIW